MTPATDTWLQLGERKFSPNAVQKGNAFVPLNEFEKSILDFYADWFSAKTVFDLTTSGSTGKPKIISVTREAMIASAQGTQQALGLKKDETALLCLDPRYIAGKMMLVRSVVIGLNVIATEPSANPFINFKSGIQVDFTALVPYQLQTILNDAKSLEEFNGLKSVLIGGAALDFKVIAQLDKLNPVVFATYGMTETISHVALQKLNTPARQEYFQALPGVHLSKDDRGCLEISADYLGKEKIVTNDLVELISKDKFRWLGRWDNIINTGGVKVIPEKLEGEIAEIFLTAGLSNRFFVAAQPDEQFGNSVVVIVEGDLSAEQQTQILENLNSALSRYERPKKIFCVPTFVETETQKINRKSTLEAALRN